MSEDDRAAKAARAKAMLRKRQAQKTVEAGGSSNSRVASPAPQTLSSLRTSTPAQSEVKATSAPAPAPVSAPVPLHAEKEGEDVAELFSSGSGPSASGSDTSWLSGLQRVESNPPASVVVPKPRYATHPPPPAYSPTEEREDVRTLAQEPKREAPLSAMSQVDLKTQQTQGLLEAERAKAAELEGSVRQLQSNVDQLSQRARQQQETITSLEAERSGLNTVVLDLKGSLAKAKEASQAERQNLTKLQERFQTLDQSFHEAQERIEQQQQTISLLVSEKASLTSEVERLEHTEAALQETEKRLQVEIAKNSTLTVRVSQLESESETAASTITALTQSDKELTDKSRDQEREIQLLNGIVHELRAQSEEHQRRVRELEEQIESDDRAERLEEILKNTQDRADKLEFQLSKLRQAHEELLVQRDSLAGQLDQKAIAEADWAVRHEEAEKQHLATQSQLASAITERDGVLAEGIALRAEIEGNKHVVAELQQKLAALTSDLASNARHLKQVQAELKTAQARAEDAEKTQKELQAEGIGLMRSLDEMRPKIVELTDEKLLLSEKAEGLERTIQARDVVIAQLETDREELRENKEAVERERDGLRTALENERAALQKDSTEVQQAYSELQAEYTKSQNAVNELQNERAKLRQVANSNVEEIRRLTENTQTHSTQLASLRSELGERTRAQSEAQDFLERAEAEMESLRLELSQKDEELERLRETASGPPSRASADQVSPLQSLDEEMLSALRQQHALELSAAHSQVRALQSSVFNAEAQTHALQRQVAALDDELAQLRPLRPSSRSSAHRPLRDRIDSSDDLRRQSFNPQRPGRLSPPATISAFEGLSPETRHKRKVSLSMLKARIDSEVASSNHMPRPSTSRSLTSPSPIHKHTSLPAIVEPPSHPPPPRPQISTPKRPVFKDESHIFWCHSCQEDLVVL